MVPRRTLPVRGSTLWRAAPFSIHTFVSPSVRSVAVDCTEVRFRSMWTKGPHHDDDAQVSNSGGLVHCRINPNSPRPKSRDLSPGVDCLTPRIALFFR